MKLVTRKTTLAVVLSAALGMSACAADPAPTAPPHAATPVTATPAVAAPAAPAPATQPAGSVVATINGKDVSSIDLDKETEQMKEQAAQRVPPEQLQQLMPRIRQQAMTNLVNKRLLLQAAVDRKIVVVEADVDKAIAEIAKTLPPGETLDSALAHVGLAKADFLRQMTESLTVQKLLAQEAGATVSDDDIAKYYAEHPEQFNGEETVSARHILVMFGDGDDAAKKAEKKKKAEGIRERLLKGEDFAKLCAETSDDPGSKDKGGLYENFGRGKMVPPFENAAFTQKVGDIGPIVETSFGYHIIKVEKHTAAGRAPLAEVKEHLKTVLEQQKKQESAQGYLTKLHDAAKITYAEGLAPATEPSTPKK